MTGIDPGPPLSNPEMDMPGPGLDDALADAPRVSDTYSLQTALPSTAAGGPARAAAYAPSVSDSAALSAAPVVMTGIDPGSLVSNPEMDVPGPGLDAALADAPAVSDSALAAASSPPADDAAASSGAHIRAGDAPEAAHAAGVSRGAPHAAASDAPRHSDGLLAFVTAPDAPGPGRDVVVVRPAPPPPVMDMSAGMPPPGQPEFTIQLTWHHCD